jgi:chromosomal replication initiator protein
VISDPDDIWPRIQAELRRAVAADMYEIWLATLRPIALEGTRVTVEAPRELRPWIAERFARVLHAAAATVIGPGAVVHVRAGEEAPGPRAHAAPPPPEPATSAPPAADDAGMPVNPRYTFDQFVIGDTNRFAHAAALAVAEMPAQAYNPLFIYGPPGVGKTHLLHSIANYVNAYGGGLSVRCTTIETFTNQFLAALHAGSVDRFKGRYRHNDVLLVDDVQFLASKAKTEEEFFHTFNALYEAGGQLVLTCDRLPRDLDALEDRLRERFEAGLVTAIRPPDTATRLTVLRKRVRQEGIVLDDEAVLDELAARVTTNLRALEGALIRVVAFASLNGRPLSPALAREVLDDLPPERPAPGGAGRPPTVERIQELTAEACGCSQGDLVSHSRRPQYAWPRQVAMYLARTHTTETLPGIGARFGGRNHTTVLHACKRTAERVDADPEAAALVRSLTERLTRDESRPA